MNTNPFVVIESLDAAGGSTQTKELIKHLEKEGYYPTQYHFPQEDTATGRLIYDKFLLEKNKRPFSRREQALLYIQDFFSRQKKMESVLTSGNNTDIIISDRYCTSTMAYQTIGLTGEERKQMLDWIEWLCWKGTPVLPKPDIVIFLDIPTEVSWKHLANKKKDYFETKDKLEGIRQSYMRLAEEQKWVVINSMNEEGQQRSIADLHDEVWQNVQSLIH